jgi:hypothetical protein
VLPVYSTAFDWIDIRPHPLNYVSHGAMGLASSHGLGLALGRPDKRVIVLEDLHVRGMQQNRHLALSVSDAGMFREIAAVNCRGHDAFASAWAPQPDVFTSSTTFSISSDTVSASQIICG